MRKFYAIVLVIMLAMTYQTQAQTTFSFNCPKDTTIFGCASGCLVVRSTIPDIRSAASTYVINPIGGAAVGCYQPYVAPDIPGTPTSINSDDTYSSKIQLPFSFPFFGTSYDSIVISGNGYVSFDLTRAGLFSHYGILSTGTGLSATSGTPQDLPNTRYDRAVIMGPYHDINIATSTSPNRRIKYETLGVAPHRKWVVSYYKVPLFDCTSLIENSHQIVLYEGSGIVEVFVYSVQNCATWNNGRAMIGMQNYGRDRGIMAPGRAASNSPWGTINMNESWRFVPASGPTLYRKVELFDFAGNLVATGDTTSIGNGKFAVTFPSVCPTGPTSYVIQSTYESATVPGTFELGRDTVNVFFANPLSSTSTNSNATCANNGIGSLTVNVTGAVGPFEYSVDNINWQSSSTFNLPPGTYTVLYRVVGNLCGGSETITIGADPGLVSGTYTADNVLCNGGTTGSIVVSAFNGTPGYEYSINGGTTYQPSGTFPNLAAGTYNIRIRDNAACTRDTVIIITQPAAPLAAASVTASASCSATPNGSITVTATGGTPGYSYSSDGGITYQTSNVFTVTNGTYSMVTKDDNGCVTATSQEIVPLNFDLTLTGRSDTTLCLGASVVLNTATNGDTFDWDGNGGNGTGLSSSTVASPTATPTAPGRNEYIVKVTLGQCSLMDTVVVNSDNQVSVNTGADLSIFIGEQIQIPAQATGATTYLWTSDPPGTAGLSATNVLNPLASPTSNITYILTATNAAGCSGKDSVFVEVKAVCIKVSNAFTPNGDGINEYWTVYDNYGCFKNVTVNVFNRYGSKVYESKDYKNDWDGRYKGKSLPIGTYYGVVDFTLPSGQKRTIKTDLTILR